MTSPEQAVIELETVARDFCELIETHLTFSELEFLKRINVVLPALYQRSIVVNALVPDEDDSSDEETEDDRMWSSIQAQIQAPDMEPFLVKCDRYRKMLTPYPNGSIGVGNQIDEMDDEVIEGCLSNDLEGTYLFLKSTLNARDSTRDQTLRRWSTLVWRDGGTVLQALAAVHFALHEEIMFEDS